MSDLSALNRTLNRALRAVNAAASAVPRSSLEPIGENTRLLAQALENLSVVQGRIYLECPDLEYHYEEGRPLTRYMREFRGHLEEADRLVSAGNREAALEELRKALGMEPPPLAHEILVARIKEVAGASA